MTVFKFGDTLAADIRVRLLCWYKRNRRDLPWRKSRDPYRIWLSEVMLQQTQVKTVIPYYNRFLSRFGNIPDLAAAPQQEVLKLWQGLGYYARARNLHRAAQTMARIHHGQVPSNWQALRKLPGVGDYIAAAVLSIAFGKPYAVVDGNVKRVLARLFVLDWPVNDPAVHVRFKAAAEKLLDTSQAGEFNQALMELGALICTPHQPLCANCPLHTFCQVRLADAVGAYPKRKLTRKVPLRHLVAAVILKKGRVLITQRQNDGLLGGLWEFPAGEVKPGQNPSEACLSVMRDMVNQCVEIQSHLTLVRHAYTHFKLKLDVFICRRLSGRIRLKGPAAFKWVRPHQIADFPMHKANLKIMPELERHLLKTHGEAA